MDQKDAFGITAPLITTASGAKMGKTAAGAVWLNADRVSPYDYWQFWRNAEDADVGKFLALFTEHADGRGAPAGRAPGAEINEAKKILATEATALLHGRDRRREAAETARRAFEQGTAADTLPSHHRRAARLAGRPAGQRRPRAEQGRGAAAGGAERHPAERRRRERRAARRDGGGPAGRGRQALGRAEEACARARRLEHHPIRRNRLIG
jgi:hypothetical protein